MIWVDDKYGLNLERVMSTTSTDEQPLT